MLLTICLSFTQTVMADVKLEFVEPEKFRDIQVSGESRKRSITYIHKHLSLLFESIAKDYIDDTQHLTIKVTDLDLPGYIEPMYGNTNRDIRIVKDNDYYRLIFKFELKNQEGLVDKEGDEKIKGFLTSRHHQLSQRGNTSVNYFKADINDWFKKTIDSKK